MSPIKSAKAFGAAQVINIVETDVIRFFAISNAPFVVVFGVCNARDSLRSYAPALRMLIVFVLSEVWLQGG
ncbi:hypothetical protein D3C78_1659100 [compost metagenome]